MEPPSKRRKVSVDSEKVEPASFLFTCGLDLRRSDAEKRWFLSPGFSTYQVRRSIGSALTKKPASKDQLLASVDQAIQSQDWPQLLSPLEQESAQPAAPSPRRVATAGRHDSFFRLLLGVPLLQSELIGKCVEQLNYAASLGTDEADALARWWLQQLRWLEHIEDPHALAAHFSQTLPILGDSLRKDLFEILPEIVDDVSGSLLADDLLAELQKGGASTSALLDCLSNLNISAQQQAQLQEIVTDLLSSVDVAHLSAVIRFILQENKTQPQSRSAVSTIRQKLEIVSLDLQDVDSAALIIHSLRTGLGFNKLFAKEYVESLHSLSEPKQVKILDYWMVFIIWTACVELRTRLDAVLKEKIVSRVFKLTALKRALSIHPAALSDAAGLAVVSIAQSLVVATGSMDPALSDFASVLYSDAFKLFSDSSLRQEILESLLCVVGSITMVQSGAETPAQRRDRAALALDILLSLVTNDPSGIKGFSIYLQSLVDFLDSDAFNSVALVRRLYSILALLAYPTAGSASRDNIQFLQILIKKQLANTSDKYVRMGIIGGAAALQRMASTRMASSHMAAARELLQDLFAATNGRPTEVKQFLFDIVDSFLCVDKELQHELVSLPEEDAIAIKNIVESEFTQNYLVDLESIGEQDWVWSAHNEVSFAINLFPMSQSAATASSLNYLSSLIRLLLSSTKYVDPHNSLEAANALLSAPLRMFTRVTADDFDAQFNEVDKSSYCIALFHAVNLEIELINAFVDQPSMQADVKCAFESLVDLEHLLDAYLGKTSSFSLNAPCVKKKKLAAATREAAMSLGAPLPHYESLRAGGGGRELDPIVCDLLCAKQADIEGKHNVELVDWNEQSLLRLCQLLLHFLRELFPPRSKRTFPLQATGEIVSQWVVGWADRFPRRLDAFSVLSDPIGSLFAHLDLVWAKSNQNSTTVVTLMLQCITVVFASNELFEAVDSSSPSALTLSFANSLRSFLPSVRDDSDARDVFVAAFNKLISFGKSICPAKAVEGVTVSFLVPNALIQCLEAVYKRIVSADTKKRLQKELSQLSHTFLNIHWEGSHQSFIETWLQIWIGYSLDPLNTILEATKSLGGDPSNSALDPQTWAIWYSTLFEELHVKFSAAKLASGDAGLGLRVLEPALAAFKTLCLLTRHFESEGSRSKSSKKALKRDKTVRANYSAALKFSRKVVDTFISKIEWIESHMAEKKEEFVGLISQSLQGATRQLQTVCHYAKEHTDPVLSKLVPPLKKSLELLVFRMKDMLEHLGVANAFWLGNLKFKDLHGQPMSSQIPIKSESSSDDSDDDIDEKPESHSPEITVKRDPSVYEEEINIAERESELIDEMELEEEII